ncbi:MAG: VOC family protein [Deltaproteobacteria bacterium]|nr:VOC family protein [Deltaproteobacteria bacterium]
MIRFDHLSLPVRDWRASRDWYVDVLGLKVEFEIAERATVAMQDESDFTIFFSSGGTAPLVPSAVLTFQVDDVEATHAALAARGIAFVHPPQQAMWGYGAELRDPDGYRIWLYDARTMREKGGG